MIDSQAQIGTDHDTAMATVKLIIVWVGTMVGGITLSDMVLTATLIFTLLQIFMLLRRLWNGQP